ncbi:MAG TPA: lysis system i-spanin subunit Rz [Rhodocyclaceae bacterium]|jgi:hypothetical protein|nr:lysis system i-spanin subunit Rz [Rhodocyclaceae bacterium]
MSFPVISPRVKLLVIVVLAGLLIGAFYAYGQQQFGLGEKAERTAWLTRENATLTKANARIKELEDQARAKEREHAQDMADASAQYQKDLKHEKAAKDRVIADLRRGDLRLQIPVTCPDAAGGSATGATGTSTGGRDGETRAELSVEASEFLVGLASEADEVVRQLTACQVVVNADRKHQGEQ